MRPFLLLSCLFLVAAGCAPPDPKAPSESANQTEILFWHGMFTPAMQRHIETAIDSFHQQHPNIRVRHERFWGHQDEAVRRLQLKLALDERPDLVWLPPIYTGDLAEANVLRPVQAFIDQDSTFDADDFLPWTWGVSSHNGTKYTLPYQTNTLALLYNKAAFRDAGIDAPPATWTELATIADRLTRDIDGDGTTDRYGFLVPYGTHEWTVWTWQTFLWQAGGQFLTDDRSAPAFHERPGVEALQFWTDLVHRDQTAMRSDPDGAWDVVYFSREDVAMQINGPWYLPRLDSVPGLEYGVAPLPSRDTQATNIGGENLYIIQTTPDREQAAWAFAKHLVRPALQKQRLTEHGQFPSRRSVMESAWFANLMREHPELRVFHEAMKYGQTRPSRPGYFSISQALGTQIKSALDQAKTPEQALNDAAETAHMILNGTSPAQ